MSRTYRRRSYCWFYTDLNDPDDYVRVHGELIDVKDLTSNQIKTVKAQMMGDAAKKGINPPKWFRQYYNQKKRTVDKAVLSKLMQTENYWGYTFPIRKNDVNWNIGGK